jgi:iron complex outermembrane receptor protein
VLWTPTRVHSAWAAVTRAVRTPSRVETDYTTTRFAGGGPTFVRLIPNPDFKPERLVAYEAGYRMRPAATVYLTASTFYNDLENTLTTELLNRFVEGDPLPRLILPVQFRNGLHGHSQGVELTADVRPAPWWRLTGNYSYVSVSVSRHPGSTDVSQEQRYEGGSPEHQLLVGTSFDAGRWSFDWWTRHVSALRNPKVPAYTASDVRVGWWWGSQVELSVVGRDLFDAHHLEWPSDGNMEIARSVYAAFTWRR